MFLNFGNFLGNIAIKTDKNIIIVPGTIHPNHQARNHLGSFLSINGVLVGSIKVFNDKYP